MTELLSGIYGCIAGSRIGSAMGALVEGWGLEKIKKVYGVMDDLYPYVHAQYEGVWDRPAGSTEDGIERQKLLCTAIIEKKGRISSKDLVDTWLKVLDPEKMKYISEPYDIQIFYIAKSGLVEPRALGSFCRYPNLVVTARSFHPVYLVNAGNTEAAELDLNEIGSVYQPHFSESFEWGAIYGAAIIEALKDTATVDSVLEAALKRASSKIPYASCNHKSPRILIEEALELVGRYSDPMGIRKELNEIYCDVNYPYAISMINENVVKALAVFKATDGDPNESVIVSSNFGRDTDCLAASAGGLSGALRGVGAISQKWIEQVEEATVNNPYTNSKRTMKEDAEGILAAINNL